MAELVEEAHSKLVVGTEWWLAAAGFV